MAKDKLTDYDSTASGNLDVGGISVAEGMLPSGVNNAIREQMSHLAEFAAGTSGVDVLKLQDDTDTNSIKLQAPASVTTTTTFTLPDGDGASGQTMITDGAGTLAWAAPYGNRNLIINGSMQVAQRGTSFTPNTGLTYSLDRYATLETTDGSMTISQDTSVVPTGFQYSLKAVTGTADASLAAGQRMILLTRIEGYDVARLELGTANAKQFTLSFYVRSSLTGTFGGAVQNSASDRNYPFTYTINTADTWERKTITITGDTSGTWNTTNSTGLQVCWGLGVGSTYSGTAGAWAAGDINSATGGTNVIGTASATWYITGVQLEVGETATPFEHEGFGTTLEKCMRFFQKSYKYGEYNTTTTIDGSVIGIAQYSTNNQLIHCPLKVPMRDVPNITLYSRTGVSGRMTGGSFSEMSATVYQASEKGFNVAGTNVSGSDGYVNYYAEKEL
jgi:hypothetical protein